VAPQPGRGSSSQSPQHGATAYSVPGVGLDDVEDSAGWDHSLAGRLERLVVHSEVLAGNPLDDPSRRPLYVYSPPDIDRHERGVPSVYLLQGFAGRLEEWLAPSIEPTVVERLDGMFAVGECPPAVIVFVDAWTSCGTSQFLNSVGTGRYLDYVCDEIVPFIDARYPTRGVRESRGISGRSSGGYGAIALSMLRSDLFGALASHAGDALFECCYQPVFPVAARELRDRFDGSWSVFRQRISIANWREAAVLFAAYGTACVYTPDPLRPGEALMPFDTATGRPVEQIWSRWLEFDPVRMANAHAGALRSMKRIYLDAGRRDEFFLDLGARALSDEFSRLGVEHTLELFEGGHEISAERVANAIRELALALS
jgi:enterochelin esterase-like enzyme